MPLCFGPVMDCSIPDRYTPSPMHRARHSRPSPLLERIVRSSMARWLAVLLIAPILVFGISMRAKFLAHCHHEQQVHLHPVAVLANSELCAADHAGDDGHGHASLGSDRPDGGQRVCREFGKAPCGLIICFDVHKQLPTRTLDFGKPLSRAAIVAIAACVPSKSQYLDLRVGSPGGALNGGPMHRLSLKAGDRLVRTSRALLI
jgi:hypothetical protein